MPIHILRLLSFRRVSYETRLRLVRGIIYELEPHTIMIALRYICITKGMIMGAVTLISSWMWKLYGLS